MISKTSSKRKRANEFLSEGHKVSAGKAAKASRLNKTDRTNKDISKPRAIETIRTIVEATRQ